MQWHEIQDEQITGSLKRLNDAHNHPSPIRRIGNISSGLLLDKHFINICSLYEQNTRFRILDVGCGTGELIFRLSNYFKNAEFVGIDSNKESITLASSCAIPHCKFIRGTFDEAKPLETFDVVVCCEVFEHVLDPDHLLDVLCSVCKPGGFISISAPSGWMYRRPSLYVIYKLFKSPTEYFKYCLFPERNWAQAVRIHPAIQPVKLRRALEKRNCKMISRQSSLWFMLEFGLFYGIIQSIERLNKIRVALWFFNLVTALDAVMNVAPLLRIFESRFVLLMERK